MYRLWHFILVCRENKENKLVFEGFIALFNANIFDIDNVS